MANKTIGQLNSKTTPASADVFVLEDTEDTKKINYDALADAILNKITSKNYTVAGSSQTLINAINTLNGNAVTFNKITTSITNYADNMADSSHAYLWNTATDGTVVGSPTGTTHAMYYRIDKINATTLTIFAWPMQTNIKRGEIYVKQKYGGDWSEWIKQPTREEIEALNSKLTIEVVQGITTSSSGAGDTGISSGSYYITNPIITNVPDAYCETFIFSNHLYIKAINRITNEPLTNTNINIRFLKIPV